MPILCHATNMATDRSICSVNVANLPGHSLNSTLWRKPAFEDRVAWQNCCKWLWLYNLMFVKCGVTNLGAWWYLTSTRIITCTWGTSSVLRSSCIAHAGDTYVLGYLICTEDSLTVFVSSSVLGVHMYWRHLICTEIITWTGDNSLVLGIPHLCWGFFIFICTGITTHTGGSSPILVGGGLLIRWWPPSTMWVVLLIFFKCHHQGCLNNSILFLIWVMCWSWISCNYELWPKSVSHLFSLGFAGGKHYQKIMYYPYL